MTGDWEQMTVAELRNYAREHHIKLSAGINKQGIIERIQAEKGEQLTLAADTPVREAQAPAEERQPAATPAAGRPVRKAAIIADDDDAEREMAYGAMTGYRSQAGSRYQRDTQSKPQDVLSTISSKAPAFNIDGVRAWHNPKAFVQNNNYHAPQHAPAGNHSPYSQRSAESGYAPGTPRPVDARVNTRAAAPSTGTQRFGPQDQQRQDTPAQHTAQAPEQPMRDVPAFAPQANAYQPRTVIENASTRDYHSLGKPTLNELLAQEDCEDGEGICVLLRDGSAYLFTGDELDSDSVIFLSVPQTRRFALRTGDRVSGKIRPWRVGDSGRYMLYVNMINGTPVDDIKQRDGYASMHPVVPSRKLFSLPADPETCGAASLPILSGQRAAAAVEGRKAISVICALSKQLMEARPQANALIISVGEQPEDVSLLRGSVRTHVWSVDPADHPDRQRLTIHLASELVRRSVEQKKDMVILLSIASPVPDALKDDLCRLFAAGRCFKEGCAVTVIAVTDGDIPDLMKRQAGVVCKLSLDKDGLACASNAKGAAYGL